MLFQPTVLRCHFSTSSHQPAVVQWKFKSYCQDRMGESLGMSSPRAQALSKRNLDWDPYLDCLDSRRTVRVVASKQGSTVTLGDFYRGREITIVHDADLQIGKLLWGDSGLYYCIITTPDDLEGKNEDSVELLVLGRTGLLADLLPSFAVEIMPEWVFVGLVILGIFLFFVLVGICWCQCCPHSCCCYVRCPCCPDSCCCPQALYEAGKAAKSGYPPSVSGVPGPYSIPSVPLGGGAPSSGMLMDKPHPPPLAPSDSTGGSHSVRKGYRIQADKERDSMKVLYYVEKELAQFDPARRMRGRYNNTISELSSLHDDDNNFRQSYHQMRNKQFPMSGDLESNPDYWSGVMGGNSGTNRGPALEYNKEDRESFRHSQPRSKSEMLSRKNFATGVPAVSMDELAAFADSYGQRSRRANANSHEARSGSRFERSEYWANLKLWFKQKISKEEFDLEAHRLLTQDNVHSHNDFLLAILTRCQILVSTPEGAGSLPWTGGSAAKPGKPKGKKKLSSVRQKFDHRFQPQNPLSGAQQFVAKDPQDDDDLKLCSHTMMLPTRGQLEGRMIVTAYEHGLDNVTEEAVSAVVYAVENHLKDILTSVVSRRKAYRVRDGHFKYAFGSNVTPQPYLKNSVVAYNNLVEGPPAFSAPCASQNSASQPHPDDAEQQAAFLLACSGDTLPASLPPVNMYDLFEALQVHREVIPTHTVYALNIERIIMKLWHPNHEELQQDKVHRQRLAAKEGLLLC
ncbi:immunoglobulin-like domain-containing receptor [Cricetulus griseus]|nr:immunoglobulin-like domain-containing receptor [Cricetulus griseus]